MQLRDDVRFFVFVLLPVLGAAGYLVWEFLTFERRALARRSADRARVQHELHRLESIGEAFEVWGHSGLVACLLLTIVAVLITGLAVSLGSSIGILFAAAVCFGVALKWQRVWPQFRRPMLLLSPRGIDSIDYGFISWDAVKGVYLNRYRGRGGEQTTLELLVPTLRGFKDQFKPSLRLFFSWRVGPARESLRILLTLTKVHPEVVYAVAEQLWRKKTGIRTHWIPNDPQFNEAEQKLQAEISRLEQIGTNDPHAVMQQFRRVEDANVELAKHAQAGNVSARQVVAAIILLVALIVMFAAMHAQR